MKLDALFFAAHPDDVELSCGGTLIKIAKSGRKCGIIDLTQGELSTRGTLETRQTEAKKAASVMGLAVRENLHIPDGNIENNSVNRLRLIASIRKYRPEIVFMPHFHDRHPDHKNANELVRDSVFYSGLEKIVTVTEGQQQSAWRPEKSYYYMQTYTFEPVFIVDISEEFESKMKAVGCYGSQFYDQQRGEENSAEPQTFISSKRFMDYLKARAVFYGFQVGADYGEPFFTEEKMGQKIENLF